MSKATVASLEARIVVLEAELVRMANVATDVLMQTMDATIKAEVAKATDAVLSTLASHSAAKREKRAEREKPSYEIEYEKYRASMKAKAIAERTSVPILSMGAWLAQQDALPN